MKRQTAMILAVIVVATGVTGAIGGSYILLSEDNEPVENNSSAIETNNSTQEQPTTEPTENTTEPESDSEPEPESQPETDTNPEPEQDTAEPETEPEPESENVTVSTTTISSPNESDSTDGLEEDPDENTTENTTEPVTNTTEPVTNTTEPTEPQVYENYVNISPELEGQIENVRYGQGFAMENPDRRIMKVDLNNPTNETIYGQYRMLAYNGSEVVDQTEAPWFIGPNEEDWRLENRIDNGSHITHYGLEMLPDEG